MMEYENEPIRGLPGNLPEGETILWQGGPEWRLLARSAFFSRIVAAYFFVLVVAAILGGSMSGVIATIIAGMIGVGLILFYAWGVARTTVYTLTNKRVVLRVGVALTTCVNIPLSRIGGAHLRPLGPIEGDIALSVIGRMPLGYALLWPHARPWRLAKPEPMLRALPDASVVAERLARAVAAITPVERRGETETTRSAAPMQGVPA